VVKADFDVDGKKDVASLLINDKQIKLGLFVKLNSGVDPSKKEYRQQWLAVYTERPQ
jgi:hypothetical protein